MITVNVWCAGGKGGGRSVQSMGEMGKDFCPNFLQPFLKNIDRRSCSDGNWQLIPIFHKPATLESLDRVPYKVTSSVRKEKQVRINAQKALEYLEGGHKVISMSSPLKGMKAQSLQSLFVEEVTHASYQPCS